ncbi:hypothetical protein KR038_002886, partial [Drosophila bunnanda]
QPNYTTSTIAMNSLSQRSPYTQIGLGAAGGFITGFVFLKVSKLVALAAGGTILVIQLAVEAGVIELESYEVFQEQRSDQARGELRIAGQTHRLEGPNIPRIDLLGETTRKACSSSRRLCVAFVGGFLVGCGLA